MIDGICYAVAYSGGEIIRFDPSAPWDQIHHVNPKTIARVSPEYIRPVAGVIVGPDGRLYRIGARGDTTLIVSTGERYVWALVSAGSNAWYAATGTHGKLLRIEGRRSRVVLDSDESNLVSLIPDGKGGVYTGGDSKGRVVHVGADGRARTVFDAPES